MFESDNEACIWKKKDSLLWLSVFWLKRSNKLQSRHLPSSHIFNYTKKVRDQTEVMLLTNMPMRLFVQMLIALYGCKLFFHQQTTLLSLTIDHTCWSLLLRHQTPCRHIKLTLSQSSHGGWWHTIHCGVTRVDTSRSIHTYKVTPSSTCWNREVNFFFFFLFQNYQGIFGAEFICLNPKSHNDLMLLKMKTEDEEYLNYTSLTVALLNKCLKQKVVRSKVTIDGNGSKSLWQIFPNKRLN